MGADHHHLSADERIDWLRLFRSETVGPATFFRLIEQFGTAARALEALPDLARRGGRPQPIRLTSRAQATRELEALERLGGRLIASIEPDFPPALRALDTAPLLTVRGDGALLTRPAVAVVGARNASMAGRRMAHTLAGDLGRSGLAVISGMARGVDTAAHEGAIATGTIAVLAGGVDVVYPPENRDLYQRLCDGGCVVSEMPPGSEPQASHFPRRNRLISGIALGVVVVEASLRSGSLITARLALDQGREVFAVPGSPLDPRCQGPNRLIKEGAILTETAADVTDVISPMVEAPMTEPNTNTYDPPPAVMPDSQDLAAARTSIVEALGPCPVTVDEILHQCQLSPAVVSVALLELELGGRLERHPGNRVSLLP
jgi:DNA processing protein